MKNVILHFIMFTKFDNFGFRKKKINTGFEIFAYDTPKKMALR